MTDRAATRVRTLGALACAAVAALILGLWLAPGSQRSSGSLADAPMVQSGPPTASHGESAQPVAPPLSQRTRAILERLVAAETDIESQIPTESLPDQTLQQPPAPGEERLRWLEALADRRSDAMVGPTMDRQAMIDQLTHADARYAELLAGPSATNAGQSSAGVPIVGQQGGRSSYSVIRRYTCDAGGVVDHQTLHGSGRVILAPIKVRPE